MLFSGTRPINRPYFFFAQIDFMIFAILTSTDRRTHSSYFFATTVLILTSFWTVATVYVNLNISNGFNLCSFGLKGLFVNHFSFINDELSCSVIFLLISAILAFATRATVTKGFETWTMQSQAIGILALAAHIWCLVIKRLFFAKSLIFYREERVWRK